MHGQIGKHFTVEFALGGVEAAHELAVAHAFHADTSVDTLNPKGAELALLDLTVTVGVEEAFFDCVLGDSPNFTASSKVSFGELHDFFAAGARGDRIYGTWHTVLIVKWLDGGMNSNNSWVLPIGLSANHFFNVFEIGLVNHPRLTEITFALGRFLSEDVTHESVLPFDAA